ncbi:MAG: VWA domain-containing protein, partial [Deltaproteobacteria bacterium]|nr:VWA domain-containing protein [Deltaproteobacteria bacterium]
MSAPVPARARSARQPLRLRRRRRSSLLLCATVWALGPGARVVLAQQPITPRIMVVFDTSSSMAWRVDSHQPAHGDGSFEFPTEAAVSCRLFEAKEALRDMLLSVGSAEARFGLARYHQEQGPQINPFPAEYPAPINYRGDCAGGDILVPFAADNLPALLSWIDQQEDFPDDPELRADGPTPLASTLLGMRDHFREHVLPDDELRDCRQHAIILLTDAQDTCGGNPVAAIRELRAITLADGSGPYRVSAFVIGFGRLGNEGEQALNALAIAAGTAVNGRAYRAQDRLALQVALGQIIGRALPHEICDGQDNDCDGEADEGVVNACGFCGPLPEEICDGLDNDCDGETDEGMRNACGECGPDREELLNGIDDDCDGTIDEGFGRIWQPEVCDGLDNDLDGETDEEVVRPCGSEPGICQPGVERCLGGRWSGVCEGE